MSVRLSVCPCVTFLFVPGGQTICLSPGDKHFSHTGGGGTNKLFVPRGQTFLTHRGGGQTFFFIHRGTNIFLMMMIIVENVSGANIPSSEARKPPAGTRILGP